jgi:hypothetical protein
VPTAFGRCRPANDDSQDAALTVHRDVHTLPTMRRKQYRVTEQHLRRLRELTPRLLLAGVLLPAFGYALQATREVTLSISVVDAATAQTTPVRVRLQDASGITPRVSGALAVSESALPIPKQAIAVMWGQDDRAQGYALQPDGSFYVDGAFDTVVPPGPYTLTVSKGFEYLQQSIRLDVPATGGLKREVTLDRWVDMPARGWYSSDDHIHLRRSPADDAAIVRWIAAEDIHIGNLLQMGDFWATYFMQYGFGPKGRYHELGRWISPGQEDPRTPEVGHTISLGADQFVRAARDYYSYDRLFDRVHELGGLTGFAHQGMSFHGYRGMVLNTLRGKNDFLELAQFCVPEGPLALEHYYMFLDLGVRLTALAGSDFPWCGRGPAYGLPGPPVAQIGNARFYTYVGGPLSFERWFAALKAGRTFVTTGPMLFLTVNGRMPGETVDVTPGTRVRVRAEALGHSVQVPLESVEVIGHGRVLARADGRGVARLATELEVTVERGMWIAAKAQAGTAQVAHTTPVYVTVSGGTFVNPGTLDARLATAEKYLGELEAELAAPAANIDQQASRHRVQLERQIAEARQAIEQRKRTR